MASWLNPLTWFGSGPQPAQNPVVDAKDPKFANIEVDVNLCAAAVLDGSGKVYVQCKEPRPATSEFCRWHKAHQSTRVLYKRGSAEAYYHPKDEIDGYEEFLNTSYNYFKFEFKNLKVLLDAYMGQSEQLRERASQLLDQKPSGSVDQEQLAFLKAQVKRQAKEISALQQKVSEQERALEAASASTDSKKLQRMIREYMESLRSLRTKMLQTDQVVRDLESVLNGRQPAIQDQDEQPEEQDEPEEEQDEPEEDQDLPGLQGLDPKRYPFVLIETESDGQKLAVIPPAGQKNYLGLGTGGFKKRNKVFSGIVAWTKDGTTSRAHWAKVLLREYPSMRDAIKRRFLASGMSVRDFDAIRP